MEESDTNSPWDPRSAPEGMPTPGAIFEMVPPPGASPTEASAIPPMPTIPPPAPLAGAAPTSSNPTPPPIPTTGSSSVAQPLLAGDYDERPDMPEPPGGGGRIAWLGAIVGAFVLLLGGGYFALTALNASGGAATPDEAVQKLIDAVNNEDFIALGEMLEPAERRTLVTPVVSDILPELERLGILSGDFDPSGVEGLDLEFNDFTYRIEELPGNPDIVQVYATGGSTTFSTDVDSLPFGSEIRTRFGDRMEDESDTTPATEDDDPLILVERDGRWYVSIWFSAAESARQAADRDLPFIDEQPAPLGSDSPQAAVENLVLEMSDFDLDGMLRRLDPDEAAALYRYSPLFIDEAQESAQELRREIRDEGVDWSVTDMGFDVERDGDDAIVELREFTFNLFGDGFEGTLEYGPQRITGRLDGEIDGNAGGATLDMTPALWSLSAYEVDGGSFSAEVAIDPLALTIELIADVDGEEITGSIEYDEAGLCSGYTWVTSEGTESGCIEDEASGFLVDAYRGQIEQLFDVAESGFPGTSIAVHETDGEWYVSPTLSGMHWLTTGLKEIDEQEFQEFLDRLDEETGDSTLRPEELAGGLVLGAIPGAGTPVLTSGLLFGTRLDPDEWLELGPDATPMFDSIDATPVEPIDSIPPSEVSTVSFAVEPGGEPAVYRDELGTFAERHIYLVELDEGQELGVTLYGSDRVGDLGLGDPLVTIEKPTGDFWLQNDDFDGLNSGIQFVATESGLWRVVVQDLNQQVGEYELTLERPPLGDAATIGVEPEIELTIDEADIADYSEIIVEVGSPFVISGELEPGFFDVFVFDVAPDTAFTITLEAAEDSPLDPLLIVRDGELELLAENDDADFDAGLTLLGSKVELATRSADVFYVEARSFGDFGEGQYTLTITAS